MNPLFETLNFETVPTMNEPISKPAREMVVGTIRIFAAEAFILPTGFITAVFLARSLGPPDYGMFALVASLIICPKS